MLQWLKGSLPARAGLAVALISIFALASALSAGVIARLSEGDAAAINIAGSLRMATYQLSWKIEAGSDIQVLQMHGGRLEKRLESAELTGVLHNNEPLREAYRQLHQRWQSELRPALFGGDTRQFLVHADSFVEQLNRFVFLLQQRNESKQSWQQTIQGLALFVTTIVLMIGMYQLQGTVLNPLQELGRANERFRAGDLRARVDYDASDELGQVARSFNAMAESIEQSHRFLESRVAEETANLAQANAALQLLYQSSRSLAAQPADADALNRLLDSFQERLPGLQLSLCLHGDPQQPSEHLIALHGSALREICSPADCATCTLHNRPNLLACPVVNQDSELGELRAGFAGGRAAQDWEAGLVQALANLIGAALSLERQREQENRLLLFEERAIIARELHDSLAQALSYMKLQVGRLQTLIRRGESLAQVETASEEIRAGLNNAYRQLRELLTTFRLKIQEGGLDKALQDTAQEFSERSPFEVHLEMRLLAFTLSANEQIHLLQIAREALSNCARHSGAGHVWMTLQQDGEEVELLIEDDGCGLSADFDDKQHHGLNIMLERARSLNGQLILAARQPQGTRVQLRFCPGFLSHPLHEALI